MDILAENELSFRVLRGSSLGIEPSSYLVVRWPVRADVSDEALGTEEARLLDHLSHLDTRCADERLELRLLVLAWSFTDDQDFCVGRADRRDLNGHEALPRHQ